MTTITTNSGDTWDIIAWRIWGDGADQDRMADLIGVNQQHVKTAIFPGNVTLSVPESTDEEPASIPPWRQ